MILSSVILRLPPPLITPPAPSKPEPVWPGGQPIGARLVAVAEKWPQTLSHFVMEAKLPREKN